MLAELLAMLRSDPRYNAIPLPQGAPRVDASVAYVAMRFTDQRHMGAYKRGASETSDMVKNTHVLFSRGRPSTRATRSRSSSVTSRVTLVPDAGHAGALSTTT
jgi:hypothetical protein